MSTKNKNYLPNLSFSTKFFTLDNIIQLKTKTIKRQLYPLTAALLLCFTTTAQLASYDLASYIVPDVSFHRLTGAGRFEQNSFSANIINQTNYEFENGFIGGDLKLQFDGFKISRKWQNNYGIVLDNSLSLSQGQNSNSPLQTFKSWRNRLDAFNTIRKYKGKLFYEWTSDISFIQVRSSTKNQGPIEKHRSTEIDLYMPLSIGHGRIENVSFAQQAFFILRKLKKKGKINRLLSHEEITAFADAIAQIRSRRVFDFRLRRIFELEQLDQFLEEANIIDQKDITYFALLNDQWVYSAGINRGSGDRFSFSIIPGIYTNSIRTPFIDQGHELYSLQLGMNYENTKPILLLWQRFFSFNLQAGFINGTFINPFTREVQDFHEPRTSASAIIGGGFFPNTRTSLELSFGTALDISWSKDNDANSMVLGLDGNHLISFVNLDFTYFLLPRFRIDLRTGINFIRVKGKDADQPVLQLSNQLSRFIHYPICNDFSCFGFDSYNRAIWQNFSINVAYEFF